MDDDPEHRRCGTLPLCYPKMISLFHVGAQAKSTYQLIWTALLWHFFYDLPGKNGNQGVPASCFSESAISFRNTSTAGTPGESSASFAV
jgi:hypothetical protein